MPYVNSGYWASGYGDADPTLEYVVAGYWGAGYAVSNTPTPTTTVGGGYDDDDKPARKRRFIRKVGDKLVITTDASAALSSVQDEQEAQQTKQPEPAAPVAPAVQEISLAEIRTVAAQYQQQAKVLQMFRQRDWAEMVALYEALMRQQDEDDIEMLLLSL